ncbi:MAG: DinB family protein, partial [Bacteroidetes bacterium]|nr:DinB family protein [Bacteroidota bacterium]
MSLSASAQSRLEYQHQTIRDLIRNVPEEALKRRVNPDKWSAFENIAHLTAYQPIFIKRLQQIQAEDEPQFSRYVGEQDPQYFLMLEKPLEELLSDIEEKRKLIFNILKAMDDTIL